MKYDDPLVAKEAKRHKKFLETFTINPGSFRINTHDYFFVNYYRFNKMTDCAVVSPTTQAGKNAYMEAFDALMEFAQLTSLILDHGGERSDANMDSFTTMKAFLSDVLNDVGDSLDQESRSVFTYCLERVDLILNLQERIIELYRDFHQNNQKFHEGDKENFTRQELDESANYLGEIGYIQYRQVVAIYEFIPKFKYIKELNNPEVNKHVTASVKKYLAEFSRDEEGQRKNVEHLTYQSNMDELTKEQHIKLEKDIFYKNLAETNAAARKDLRHPK